MAKRKPKKPVEEYTSLGLKVRGSELEVGAGINGEVRDTRRPQPTYARVHQFVTRAEIAAECIYPPEREGEIFQITFYGEDDERFGTLLEDYHEQDDEGGPRYVRSGGKSWPVYRPPSGIGTLMKSGGAHLWLVWLRVPERTVGHMLTLLAGERQLYLDLRERKIGRHYWVADIQLQTKNPVVEWLE